MPEPINAKTNPQLWEGILRDEILDSLGAKIVVGALIFEAFVGTAILCVGNKNWLEALNIFATVLIALGVWMEIKFGGRSLAGLHVLLQRAEKETAEANERAANAELKTELLKKQFSGRRVLPEQALQIANAVRGKTAHLDLLIEFHAGDPEAYLYGLEIVKAFKDSGIEKLRFCGNSYLSGMVFGLWIMRTPDTDTSMIEEGFNKADVAFKGPEDKDMSTHFSRNVPPPNAYIFVAPKPPLLAIG